MSKEDLRRFVEKVQQLKDLVESLDVYPSRRTDLAACNTHEDVVKLAKSWGFDIGRRWGEGF